MRRGGHSESVFQATGESMGVTIDVAVTVPCKTGPTLFTDKLHSSIIIITITIIIIITFAC